MMTTNFTTTLRRAERAVKRATCLLIAAFALMSAQALTATAQMARTIRVEIPFAFTVGETTLPAGVYTVSKITPNTLALRGEEKQSAIVATTRLTNRSASSRTALLFNRYGQSYFLAQVLPAGAEQGFEVPTSAGEEALLSAGASADTVSVTVSNR